MQGLGSAAHIASEDLGLDAAGADLGHPDAASDRIVAQLAAELMHGSLRRMVGGVPVEVVDAGDRTDVDDMAEVALDHPRHEDPGQLQYRAQVHVDQRIQVVSAGIQDIARTRHPGAVDQNVDLQARQLLSDGVEVAQIECVRDDPQLGGQLLQAALVSRHGVNGDVMGNQATGDGLSHARRGSGDQRCAVIVIGHACSPSSVVTCGSGRPARIAAGVVEQAEGLEGLADGILQAVDLRPALPRVLGGPRQAHPTEAHLVTGTQLRHQVQTGLGDH
ncbi:hypothetical protein SDC9_146056 [bioreactor metagenome]|uniref:Uncharacterized protein n=1 Tax=bioreactor metagenome TaxID=1076179 RepID=A0A645EB23_9ZZZZ